MFKLPKFEINWAVLAQKRAFATAVEFAGCIGVLVGVAHWSVPAAVIAGSVGAIFYGERNS